MSRRAYLLLIPAIVALGTVEVYPLAYSIFLSFTDGAGAFVGITNYSTMIQSPDFWNSLAISLGYSTGSTLLALGLAIGFVFLLLQEPRGKSIYEAVMVLPLAAPPIVVGILWSPSGLWDDINTFVHFTLGLPYIDVLSPYFFFPVMVLSDAWEWSPLIMLIGLSIAGSIRNEVYEAAAVSGASAWQTFRRITLPTIVRSPVLGFILVLRFVDAMRSFEVPFAWSAWVQVQQTVGSPVDSLSLYLYKLMFFPVYQFPSAYISAVAVTLLLATVIGATLLLRLHHIIGGPGK